MNNTYWVSLQVRPVGDFCNIACSYCVYGLAKDITRMPDEVLSTMTRKTLEHNGDGALFNWHGGEPTLAGIDFYRKALAFQKQFGNGFEIRNQIQTNAVSITPEMAQFFFENNFGVGVSLDGPAALHNSTRLGKHGQETYALTVRGIETLRKYGNDPAVIATVSKPSLSFSVETFHHLVNLGFKKIHYSVVFESKPDKTLEISNEEWYRYLHDVFREWGNLGDDEIEVREINEIVSWIAGEAEPSCTSIGTCGHWMVVDHNGDIYPCEVLGRDRHYGNIMQQDFIDVINGPKHTELVQIAAARPEKCQSCNFLNLCNNGCTNMRLVEGSQNPLGLYAFCEQRLDLFTEIDKAFSEAT